MRERDFYRERRETKTARLSCPHCREPGDFQVRWLVREKKGRLPHRTNTEDRRRFTNLRSYMVREDEYLFCPPWAFRAGSEPQVPQTLRNPEPAVGRAPVGAAAFMAPIKGGWSGDFLVAEQGGRGDGVPTLHFPARRAGGKKAACPSGRQESRPSQPKTLLHRQPGTNSISTAFLPVSVPKGSTCNCTSPITWSWWPTWEP